MEVEEEFTAMWPEDNEGGSQFNVDSPRDDQDVLKEVVIDFEPSEMDLEHLHDMTNHSEKGSSQLSYLVKNWENKQANAVRLLRQELDCLSQQREEAELKRLDILEQDRFDNDRIAGRVVPEKKYDVPADTKDLEIDAEYDTVVYWKQRSVFLEKKLEESRIREQLLLEKLEENIKNMEKQSTPVQELSDMLKRADNFLHFILQNAPTVLGHMDKELRYRFIYNHYPSSEEEDIIGKTDTEFFSGEGVKEFQDFKREVLERGLPAKREITYETELFGSKTFLVYVEPVFSKAGETIGLNYIGMDVTDQVRKRERMAKLQNEIAVQRAMETQLNKTIHITEETMRAKQMLATMSHEIRPPLREVVGTANILSTTNLDRQQRELLNVMISSGDFVLQLISDILDLPKVESGVMRLEAKKFRPREVVRHVLQTAAASLRKMLTLEGHISDDVPIEVIGDLRITQILTNLISNAIKFTHEGKVGIRVYVVPAPYSGEGDHTADKETDDSRTQHEEYPYDDHNKVVEPKTPSKGGEPKSVDDGSSLTTVWIHCDVYDTGIGIAEHAFPALFNKYEYMQVSADHAQKHERTGLGLAICKQLVELMGGLLKVTSKENSGSTFTFELPYRVSPISEDNSDNSDKLADASGQLNEAEAEDLTAGCFLFQPGSQEH